MALACLEVPGAGCGTCETCRRIGAGLHPDVPTFAPDGAQLVIEQAKAIGALAQSRPHEAAVRGIIVDDADALHASAANSLLKTLEEPAPRNHLVLCTSAPDRLLPTIRSRAQRVRFRPLAEEALLRIATERGLDRGHASVIAAVALADGSAARMLAAARADDGAAWEAVGRLRAAVTAPGMTPALDAAAALGGDKENKEALPPIIALLARLYRDALVAAAGAPDSRSSATACQSSPPSVEGRSWEGWGRSSRLTRRSRPTSIPRWRSSGCSSSCGGANGGRHERRGASGRREPAWPPHAAHAHARRVRGPGRGAAHAQRRGRQADPHGPHARLRRRRAGSAQGRARRPRRRGLAPRDGGGRFGAASGDTAPAAPAARRRRAGSRAPRGGAAARG